MAPPGAIKPAPLVPPPPVDPAAAAPAPAVAEPAEEVRRTPPRLLIGVAAVIAVGAGLYFGWPQLKPLLNKSAAAKPAPAKAGTPDTTAASASETLSKIAHAPANAINKAQDAIAARRAGGQARIDAAAAGEDAPDRPFGPAPTAPISPEKSAPRPAASSTTVTTIAPGVTATTQVDAAPEASPAFRSFVANAKVSGVFQGNPARAVINGRLVRSGDVVDGSLGVHFDGIDNDRRQLVFKDKSGATVSRRF